MQGNVEQAFMLTCAGNAFLQGKKIDGFWPDAGVFSWTKTCDFRTPPAAGDGDDYPLQAADPLAWFAGLKRAGRRGLRLHVVEPELAPDQQAIGLTPRMSVAFVGGGPRWLIECVGASDSELWQGFDRFGDRDDPKSKIWLTTWILQGETRPGALPPMSLAEAEAGLRAALPRIEAYARREGITNFADLFAQALAALDGETPDPRMDRSRYDRWTTLTPAQLRIRSAMDHAWVFGGMGSWNDISGGGEEYDTLSQQLFSALTNAVCGLANSTCRG